MNWDEAMDIVHRLRHSEKPTEEEARALDVVLSFDWGNSKDKKSAVERAWRKKPVIVPKLRDREKIAGGLRRVLSAARRSKRKIQNSSGLSRRIELIFY